MAQESKKIFADPHFKVSATCVRVPVLRTHCESVNVEFREPFDVESIYAAFRDADGVEVFEDRANNRWAMPLDAAGKDPVYVGRVRKDPTRERAFEFWVVGDQIRKGAALNAIQIAEKIIASP